MDKDTKSRKIKELLDDLKDQKRCNVHEEKRYAKLGYYKDAAHLDSVNTALDYVIGQLEIIIHEHQTS